LISLFVIGVIIYAMSSSKPTATSAPVAPVPQIVAPDAAQVVPKHIVKKHKQKHATHGAGAMTTRQDEAPAADSSRP
jgi:MFS superfamily sulfate permease-like transporter